MRLRACTPLQLPALLTSAPAQPPYAELISKSEDAVLKQMQARTPSPGWRAVAPACAGAGSRAGLCCLSAGTSEFRHVLPLLPAQAITQGITGIVEKVQQLLIYFEKKYRQAYEQDKDMYMM